ncbi:transglutaminase-like cysteine peptidase [Sulfurimonas sp.]|uniref:transglutaminase-like cysteine peptidase n=1 Tax=Sulfurimonas sp. TaxID=2022749 RepID=UPI00263298DC|nr:transglutaminase-like cysteine peptidase [Sulfurimonas sp.]MCW8895392.1 transglutaminase-like cysteine peptidase [Sulfurimonas sp.]
MKFFLFFFLISIGYASEYPHFSERELQDIKMKSGIIAKNRILDYKQTVTSFKEYSKSKQLEQVNFYLNKLLPQYDAVIQKQEDYWATPKEFLITGYGDCEDYVIIKYFTLLKLGFKEEELFLTTVHDKYHGGYHMVLSYFKTKHKPPLILDNLSFKILDLKQREDLEADLFVNSSGVYKIDKEYKLIPVAKHFTQYDKLLRKIQKEN